MLCAEDKKWVQKSDNYIFPTSVPKAIKKRAQRVGQCLIKKANCMKGKCIFEQSKLELGTLEPTAMLSVFDQLLCKSFPNVTGD